MVLGAFAGAAQEANRVLDDDPTRVSGADEPDVLVKESVEVPELPGSSASEPCTVGRCEGGVLAWEPADDDVREVEVLRLRVGNVITLQQSGPALL